MPRHRLAPSTDQGISLPGEIRNGPHSGLPDGLRGPVPTDAFGSLDFHALWRGRERTTQVERALLAQAVGRTRWLRLLEIGTGEGRVSEVGQAHAESYIGLDITPQFVARIPGSQSGRVHRVAGNVYCLPFVEGAFDAAVMIRTYNFLLDPRAALREVARVLAPGTLFVLSYNPKPSVATLIDDLKVALSKDGAAKGRRMSFSQEPVVPVYPSSFPAWVPTRLAFRETLISSGFTPVLEFPCGLEDYWGLRSLPARVFVGLAHALSRIGWFPSRFVAARRGGNGHAELPPFERIWRCPQCHGAIEVAGGLPVPCGSCGIPKLLLETVIDARPRGPRTASLA